MVKKPSRRVNSFLLKKRDEKIGPFLKELFYCWGLLQESGLNWDITEKMLSIGQWKNIN